MVRRDWSGDDNCSVRRLRRQAGRRPSIGDSFGQRRRKSDGGTESRRAEGRIQRQGLQAEKGDFYAPVKTVQQPTAQELKQAQEGDFHAATSSN